MPFPPEPDAAPSAKAAKPLNPFVQSLLRSVWTGYSEQVKGLALGALDKLKDQLPELVDKAEQWVVEELPKLKPQIEQKLDEVIDAQGPKIVDKVFEQVDKLLEEK